MQQLHHAQGQALSSTQQLVSELEAANERSRETEAASVGQAMQVETLRTQLEAESKKVTEVQQERDEVVQQLQQAQDLNRSVIQRDAEKDAEIQALQALLRETEAQVQRSCPFCRLPSAPALLPLPSHARVKARHGGI